MPPEIARVDGKPKQVWQKYPGTAEKIVELKEMVAKLPHIKIKSFHYDKTAAILIISEELSFMDTVNRHTDKKKDRDTGSVERGRWDIHRDFRSVLGYKVGSVQQGQEKAGFRGNRSRKLWKRSAIPALERLLFLLISIPGIPKRLRRCTTGSILSRMISSC
ncbi:MAG: hypothetical protein EF812_07300 [Methanosarcinales archaeon]|nr:MAG: hypothetical protein EF812_07300 [Methanosarcinales archaeon]